jgi:hypothetical protein
MLNPMRRLSLMSQTMLETTIKHPFTDDEASPDTDAFYQTLLFEIDELIDTTNFRESSISLTFNDEKTKLVLSVS